MSDLIETFQDGILTLTINRPKAHNTMTEDLSDALKEAIGRSGGNPDIRCLVITGAGKIFCAGGDVGDQASGALAGDETDPDLIHKRLVKMIREGSDLFGMLYNLPKPTLAIMPGAAAGAGLALALACDFRLCLDTAKLTTAFSKIGLSCDSAMSYFLPRLVGGAKARELCFFSEVVTGQQAYDLGLVTKVTSQETFQEEASAFAKRLASLPTIAIANMKQSLIASEPDTLTKVLDIEAENVVQTMSTDDHKKAAAAFLNREKVAFEGR